MKSDEGGYRELRRWWRFPAGSLLISAGTRGVRSSNEEIEYIDLIDVSLKPDYGPGAVDDVLKSVSDATSRGRSVFYVYTRLEADGGNLGGWAGYQEYFEAIDETHSVELVLATANTDFRLYRVVPEPSGVSR